MSWKLPADFFTFSPDDDNFPNVYYFVQQFGVFLNQLTLEFRMELPRSLADIYHLKEEVHFAKKQNRSIGF